MEVRGVPVWVVACAGVVLSGAGAATWISHTSATHSIAPQLVPAVTQAKPAETIVEVGRRRPLLPARRNRGSLHPPARPQQHAFPTREPERKQRHSVWTRPLLIIKFGSR